MKIIGFILSFIFAGLNHIFYMFWYLDNLIFDYDLNYNHDSIMFLTYFYWLTGELTLNINEKFNINTFNPCF